MFKKWRYVGCLLHKFEAINGGCEGDEGYNQEITNAFQ